MVRLVGRAILATGGGEGKTLWWFNQRWPLSVERMIKMRAGDASGGVIGGLFFAGLGKSGLMLVYLDIFTSSVVPRTLSTRRVF